MNEPCRHCGSNRHRAIDCHQLKTIDTSTLKPIKIDPSADQERAARVRSHLHQLSELLAGHNNHSGARAAFVLASVPQNDAMLFLERLFNESA